MTRPPCPSLARAVEPARGASWRACALALVLLLGGCGGASSSPSPRSGASASTEDDSASESPRRVTAPPPAGRSGAESGAVAASSPESAGASRSPLAARYGRAAAIDAQEGRASYYSDRLAGRSTASGEPYRPQEYSAASRELRFGTILRVIRVDTGAVTYVRVNDRGPFGDRRRIVDLSRAAAEELDMIRAGVVSVRIEVVHVPPR